MPKIIRLDPDLLEGPFSIQEARGRGFTRARLLSRDLSRPFCGVRMTAEGFEAVEAQCSAYAQRMRDTQFFTHSTAARLWHVPLPQRFRSDEPVHVASEDRARIRCAGVIGHQLRDTRLRVRRLGRFRVSDPASTWCQLASILSLDDLVAAGDAFVHDPVYRDTAAPAARPFVSLQRLVARGASYQGPGAGKLRRAVGLVRVGSESPKETELRLLLLRHGLPEPELNVAIFDRAGTFVSRGDLFYREQRVLLEYDGDQHRTDTAVYESDQVKRDELRAMGIRIISVRQAGLSHKRPDTVQRVRDALAGSPPGYSPPGHPLPGFSFRGVSPPG